MLATNRNFPAGLACLLLAVACGGGGDDAPDDRPDPDIPVTTTTYVVNFSADQVIGGAAATSNSVTATANLSTARGDGTTASGSVTVSGASASAVTINAGYAGENGPVAIALQNSGGNTWNLPAGTELDDDEYYRLIATGYYVAIETPGGALRGQILPPGWALGVFELDASRVIPAVSSNGTAQAGFTVNPMTGQTSARITLSGVSDVISAGIRDAIAGARGEVVIAFEQDASNANVWGTRDINNPDAGSQLTSTGIDLLLNGRLYFSVETMTNTGGELRAQIIGDETAILDVPLTSDQVVSSGSPAASNATGTATVTWTEPLNRLAVAVNTDSADVTSVTVNAGAPGEVGPLVINLMPDVTLPGNWHSPVTELSDDQVATLLAGNFYVSVVTAANPEGELRGQIVESAPQSPLSISTTIDESTRQDQPVDHTGGEMSLTTSTGVQVSASIPAYAVADMSGFQMAEITAIDGFPGDVDFLAGVQMGPAGRTFGRPVTLNFDVTGKRRPGTMLIGFRSDSDGRNLTLWPLRNSTGEGGWYSAAMSGTQVSLDTVTFSNYGLIELLIEDVPPLVEQFQREGADFELPEEFILKAINAALDSSLDREEIDSLTDELLAELVRERRADLHGDMVDFMQEDTLTTDDHLEYAAIGLSVMAVNMFDMLDGEPVTSNSELQDSIGLLVGMATVYGAGLHLQCFVNPVGVNEPLGHVALTLILHLAEDLVAGEGNITFDDVAEEANKLSECYNQYVLDAYFESFDVPDVDLFTGEAQDIDILVTNNLTGATEPSSLGDIETDVRFQEPRLVSTNPLTIEFLEVSETVVGVLTDTARIVFDEPGDDERTARIELAEEQSFSHATTPAEQEDGERPVITNVISTVAAGPIVVSLDEIEIAYHFDVLETTNALLENRTRHMTGEVSVSKELTPLAFSFEIDLFD